MKHYFKNETFKYQENIPVFMEDVRVLEKLFDNKMLSILKLFIADKEKQYYLREIAKLTKTSPASTYRILNKLCDLEIIQRIEIKNAIFYQMEENKKTEFLEKFLKTDKRILDVFVENVKNMPGLKTVILHGKEKKDMANVLLIGENIDANEVKRLCAETKEKFNFTISSLTLTQEQYNQMSSMGLFSGTKKILYS